MAKWMGFFLSEHQTALTDRELEEDVHSQLSLVEKFTLLSQGYVNQISLVITIREGKRRRQVTGIIVNLSETDVILKGPAQHERILIEEIIQIRWEEVLE